MKVKDLIVELKSMNPELDIILQKDPEGNGYSPISGADVDCIYDDGECGPPIGLLMTLVLMRKSGRKY